MFLESKPQYNADMSRDFGVTIYVKAFLSRVLWRLKWSCIYFKIASTIKRLRAHDHRFFSLPFSSSSLFLFFLSFSFADSVLFKLIVPKKTHLLASFHLNGYKVRLGRFQNYYSNFCAFILNSV